MRRLARLFLAIAVLVLADRSALASTSAQVVVVGDVVAHRMGHTATPLADGRVLVAGGVNESGTLASTEVFDPMSAAFAPAGSLASPRVWHTATRLSNGQVLIAGGSDAGGTALDTAELFDPASGLFMPLPKMHFA